MSGEDGYTSYHTSLLKGVSLSDYGRVKSNLKLLQVISRKVGLAMGGKHMEQHLSTIIVILDAVLEHLPADARMPIDKQTQQLIDKWVDRNSQTARASTSSTLVNLMDGLARELVVKILSQKNMGDYHKHPEFEDREISGWPKGKSIEVKVFRDPEYATTFFLTKPYKAKKVQRLEIILTAGQLHTLFNRYCKNKGLKNPFDNPISLGCRISSDRKIMKLAGWEYVQGGNPEKITYKRKGGYDHWRFSKIINGIA